MTFPAHYERTHQVDYKLLRLEILAVGLDSVRVRNDDGVSDTVRSCRETCTRACRQTGK